MENRIDHVSASSLKAFSICQRRFWLDQIGQLKTVSSTPANFGSLFHIALEHPEQIQGINEALEQLEDTFYSPKLLDNALKAYKQHENNFPAQPTKKLREVCFQIDTSFVPILGYTDFVYQYGEELVFGDDKTTRRDMNVGYFRSLQYQLYSIAIHTGNDIRPRKKKVNVVALRPSGKVEIKTYTAFITKEEIERAKYFIQQILDQVEWACITSKFFPNMNSCHPQPGEGFKCGYKDLCQTNIGKSKEDLYAIALAEGIASYKEPKKHFPLFRETL